MWKIRGRLATGLFTVAVSVLIVWFKVDALRPVKADGDYMPLELRAQVEQFKKLVSSEPTSGETLDAHAR